ncbi:MAG TPA: hypothetical protein VFE25_12195 [Opitutaceae bacterium]|jgi:hypothetical protein|nr:hypothetical protein [Opitutaceae bacterium]
MSSESQVPAGRPFFKVALNLPHAGRVARRILIHLPELDPPTEALIAAQRIAVGIIEMLDPCMELDENPSGPAGLRLREHAAKAGRLLVDQIESGNLGNDRLGQSVRNFFECLELGQEGADISLRAGENPASMQRPF